MLFKSEARSSLRTGLLITASVLAACAGGSPAANVDPSPTTEPGIRTFVGGDVALAPGTYLHPDFRPSFTFNLDKGWQGHHDEPGEFFNLSSGETLVAFARPTYLPGSGSNRIPIEGLDIDRVIALITENPGLGARLLPPLDVEGRLAPRVELRPTRPRTTVFGSENGDFGAFPENRYRVIGLKLDGVILLAVAEASGMPYGDLLDQAERVITSVRPHEER